MGKKGKGESEEGQQYNRKTKKAKGKGRAKKVSPVMDHKCVKRERKNKDNCPNCGFKYHEDRHEHDLICERAIVPLPLCEKCHSFHNEDEECMEQLFSYQVEEGHSHQDKTTSEGDLRDEED